MAARNSEARKFLEDVVLKYEGDECLIWPYTRSPKGYAILAQGKGKSGRVCRFICEIINGPPPSNKHHAAHKCGKGFGGCVTPKHLRWKTPKENNEERAEHGTIPRGTNHANSKLTELEVSTIREIYAYGGVTHKQLAALYGVTKQNITALLNRKTWRHVNDG